MVGSVELYDKFAPYYRKYSEKKNLYLNTVNRLVLNNLPKSVSHILDVGCGDGVRGMYLFNKSGAKSLLLIDNSPEMVKIACRYINDRVSVKEMDITQSKIRHLQMRFDVIFCLWNVLGHIPAADRLRCLKNMKQLLTKRSRLYLDVSNRYNLRYYGWQKVLFNIGRDIIKPSETNGDFNYQITINDRIRLDSSCHFYTPSETADLINKSGLKVKQRFYVDYNTGELRNTFLEGHILYILSK